MSVLTGVLFYCASSNGTKTVSVIWSSWPGGVRNSGGFNVLKKRSGLSELSIISWVSAIEGCPLSGVPL